MQTEWDGDIGCENLINRLLQRAQISTEGMYDAPWGSEASAM